MISGGFRNTISAVMLAILLPVFTVLPFHHHDTPEQLTSSCEQCSNHQPHHGHLTTEWNIDNCLVCQFLGVTYVPSQSQYAPPIQVKATAIECFSSPRWQNATVQLFNTRAPPSLF